MPDDPAFVRAVAERPEDDAPRLIYADVLEESGEEAKQARAEFIRVQIEKHHLQPHTPRWNELWRRDSALLDWARRWRAELPPLPGITWGGFRRGFLDKIETSGDLYAAHGTVIHAHIPVRDLFLGNLTTAQAETIGQNPDLVVVRNLRIVNYGDLVEAAPAPTTRRRGRSTPIIRVQKAETLWAICRWPELPNLASFDLQLYTRADYEYHLRHQNTYSFSTPPNDWLQTIEACEVLRQKFKEKLVAAR